MKPDFHVLVAGGGVPGALTAGLLARQGLRVAIIEPRRPQAPAPESDFDPRVVALSPASRNALAAGGAWRRLVPERVAPFERMQVCAESAQVTFRAAEHGLETLGWIAELPALAAACWDDQEARGEVECLAGTRIREMQIREDHVRVTLDGDRGITGRILVAADGARSRLRRAAGIAVKSWHYNQRAVVCHLTTAESNSGLAWQRFTGDGPLALLPLADGRSSLVWSVAERRANALAALEEPDFLEEVGSAAADAPFGEFTAASRRYTFPLVRRQAETLNAGRVVLAGDAARTVHPLAGQGLNLGILDAACLAESLSDWQPETDPMRKLTKYVRRRLSDGTVMAAGIHAFNEIAATGLAGRLGLAAGFAAIDRLWPARDAFVRRACGLNAGSRKSQEA